MIEIVKFGKPDWRHHECRGCGCRWNATAGSVVEFERRSKLDSSPATYEMVPCPCCGWRVEFLDMEPGQWPTGSEK